MEDVKANPSSIKWGGGSAGGTDQILVGLLAKAAGADPKAMKYIAYSGGGETKAALLSGDLTVAVSGASEFADLVTAGKLRALAVSGADRHRRRRRHADPDDQGVRVRRRADELARHRGTARHQRPASGPPSSS